MTYLEHRNPRIRFDANGIYFKPRLFSAFQLHWSDVDFVSATPMYERVDGNWRPELTSIRPLAAETHDLVQELVQAGILELKIAVHNRYLLPRWMSIPLGSIYAKPLYEVDGHPEPMRGVVTLDLKTSRLSVGVELLFELISTHSRFDLIVSGD